MKKVSGKFDVIRNGYEATGWWTGYWEWEPSDDPKGEYDYNLIDVEVEEVCKYDENKDDFVHIEERPNWLEEAVHDECMMQLEEKIGYADN